MIYSIGHSTLSIEDFVRVAQPLDVVLDIRSHPTSRWGQFRRDALAKWLPEHGIRYEWEPGLGGWTEKHHGLREQFLPHGVDLAPYMKGSFPKGRINERVTSEEGRPWWYVRGFYDYQWFMTLPEFREAADRLMARNPNDNVGIMCCEALYWACHRSMVADWVVARGGEVIHLQPKPTLHSAVIGNRLERYEPEVRELMTAP